MLFAIATPAMRFVIIIFSQLQIERERRSKNNNHHYQEKNGTVGGIICLNLVT
jgi:hypothetical protein